MHHAIRVLIIEDDEDDYILTRDLLRESRSRYSLHWASTYEEGLAQATSVPFDACLLDYRLGASTGLDFIREIGAANVTLPTILLTAERDLHLEPYGVQTGSLDYLLKNEITAPLLDRSIRYTIERSKSFRSAKASEKFLQSALDALSTNIAILDESGRIIAVNASWRRYADANGLRSADYAVNASYLEVALRASHNGCESAGAAYRGITDVMHGAKGEFYQEYACHSPHEQCWFALRATRFQGTPERFVAVAHENITDRKLAEASLLRSQSSLAYAQRLAQVGNWEFDLLRDEMYASEELFRIFGVADSCRAERSLFWARVHPEDVESLRQAFANAMTGGPGSAFEHRIVRPNGNMRVVCEHVEVERDITGQPVKLIGATQDVTDRKRVDDAIAGRERRFRALLEHSSDAVLVIDHEHTVKYASPSTRNVLGHSEAELVGSDSTRLLDPDIVPQAREWLNDLGRYPGMSRVTRHIVRGKGESRRWVEGVVTNAVHEPSVAGFVCNYRDISERHEVEVALRQSQLRFDSLVQSTIIGVCEFDASETIVYANDAYLAMLGYAREDIAARRLTIEAITPLECRLALADLRGSFLSTGKFGPTEWTLVRKDSRRIRAVTGAARLDSPDRAGIAYLIDISELDRARWELEKSDQRFRSLFENATDLVITADVERRVTSLNKSARAVLGYSAEESLGRPLEDLLGVATDGGDAGASGFSEIAADATCEVRARAKDGRLLTLEVSTQTMYAGDQVMGLQAIARDVTDRRNLEGQLQQIQKMEAIGRLAGGIAHDFNNLLTIILTCTGNAAKHGLEDRVRTKIGMIDDAAHRAAALTRQLLAFSRKQVLEPKILDINEIACELQPMLQRIIGEDITFTVSLHPEAGHVFADRGQIGQVILNLFTNSREAMPSGGCLTLTTGRIHLEHDDLTTWNVETAGEYTTLCVLDTGIGMDEATRSKAFEPFFTTKPIGQGTGLGLSTLYGIVKQSRGGVILASTPGVGTSVSICLPRQHAPSSKRSCLRVEPAAKVPAASASILVVEDEPTLRLVVQNVLTAEGYRVTATGDADAALRVLYSSVSPDLLLTDVVMREGNGPDLVARLPSHCAGLKVVYMSGYAESKIDSSGPDRGRASFIQKPFSPEELLRCVSGVLAGDLEPR